MTQAAWEMIVLNNDVHLCLHAHKNNFYNFYLDKTEFNLKIFKDSIIMELGNIIYVLSKVPEFIIEQLETKGKAKIAIINETDNVLDCIDYYDDKIIKPKEVVSK